MLAWSPDGKWLAVDQDGITLLDTSDWHVAVSSAPQGYTEPITSLTWSVDGTQIATAQTDGTVRIRDITTGLEVQMLEHHDWILGVSWSSGNENLIHTATLDDDTLTLIELNTWDVITGELLSTPHSHPPSFSPFVRSMARYMSQNFIWMFFMHRILLLICFGIIQTIRKNLPDTYKLKVIGLLLLASFVILVIDFAILVTAFMASFTIQQYTVPHIAFSPDGTRLATNTDGRIDIKDVPSRIRPLAPEDIPFGGDFSPAWNSSSQLLAIGGLNGADILNIDTGEVETLQVPETESNQAAVEVAWSYNGQLAIIYQDSQDHGGDYTLQIWDTESN